MYMLACTDGYQYPGAGNAPYVLDIFPVALGLGAIASDQSLCLFSPADLGRGPLARVTTSHGNLKAARPYDAAQSVVATAGEDGTVAFWDLRHGSATQPVLSLRGTGAPILSLGCSSGTHTVVGGTEFADHQASVLIWDARAGSAPRIEFNDVHSDDVTELNFHPTESHILLSGSTDGLVNVYDTRLTDEDEVVIQAFNHGSVHVAGFLNETEIYAASHDEKVAIYDMAQGHENGGATLDFDDIRPVLGCQYLANISPKLAGAGAVFGVGSQDQEMFQLVHLSKTSHWALDRDNIVGLPGAHGSELVRSFRLFDEEQLVVTAGEDGCVKAWRPG